MDVAPLPARTLSGESEVTVGEGLTMGTNVASALRILTRGIVAVPPSLVSWIGRPFCCSAWRIVSTLAPGTACFMIAKVPATWGAAIDVPLSASYSPPGTDDVMFSPGAKSESEGATSENQETTSVLSVEPTLTADDTHAGDANCEVDPSLPDATVVAMPRALRLSMIGLYGWSSHGGVNSPPPRLMLTDAMLCVPAAAQTYSSPAMMS